MVMNYRKEPFYELHWHDAELLEVKVDRRNPGENDIVQLRVLWPNGDENSVIFGECMEFHASMNFNFVGAEPILDATVHYASEDLTRIKKLWQDSGANFDTLRCYEIEMNTSASILKIYAREFSVEK